MKISLSWLRDYLRTDKSAAEIAKILTDAGLEVGAIESNGVTTAKVVAAQVLESVQHPNADRLSVCKVDDGSGSGPRQIVCGAKNYKVGDKVPLAQPGAVMPGDFKIKVGKLRGVESEGMMCSSKELGLGEGSDGLLILSPETQVGTPLTELFPAEEVFEIEITPNRPDWLGHLGVAREAAAFGCGDLIESSEELPVPKRDPSMATIAAPSAASFYSIRRI
jgi:phenylalanyl-tRNA synthetase beta chain